MSKDKRTKKGGPAARPAAPENKSANAAATPLPKPQSIAGHLWISLAPRLALLVLAEVAAHFIPGDLNTNRFFYVAGGHQEYFGTTKLDIPYRLVPPYYWLPVPNTPITNNKGFRGRDWVEEKPPGVIRIASLGDSFTLGGQESYSERLDRLLREALGTNKYEVLNGGVGSSSTYQMLQILEQQIMPMHPDWVVVSMGWNDRWIHDGRRDSTHVLPDAKSREIQMILGKSRLYKAIVFYIDKLRSHKMEQRVPPEEFKRNLRTFVRICREHHMRLVFTTPPDGCLESAIRNRFNDQKNPRDWDSDLYDLYKDKADGPLGVWKYLCDLYNNAMRDVAKSENIELLDLYEVMPQRQKLYQEPPHFFYKDGIHLTELGLQELANQLALQLMSGEEKQKVEAYLESPEYYARNAYKFASEYQYADANLFASEAEKRGLQPPPNWGELKAQIEKEEPFFDLFNAARIGRSQKVDPAKTIELYKQALAMRPDDQGCRLDLAEYAKEREVAQYELSIKTAVGSNVQYTPENLSRALWDGVEAANEMGRGDLVGQLLQEILRRFPNDQRAQQIMANAARR